MRKKKNENIKKMKKLMKKKIKERKKKKKRSPRDTSETTQKIVFSCKNISKNRLVIEIQKMNIKIKI